MVINLTKGQKGKKTKLRGQKHVPKASLGKKRVERVFLEGSFARVSSTVHVKLNDPTSITTRRTRNAHTALRTYHSGGTWLLALHPPRLNPYRVGAGRFGTRTKTKTNI